MPADLQAEVYRTVNLRGPNVDETWAPWWRAQARAIHHVGVLKKVFRPGKEDVWLQHELAVADQLERGGSACQVQKTS